MAQKFHLAILRIEETRASHGLYAIAELLVSLVSTDDILVKSLKEAPHLYLLLTTIVQVSFSLGFLPPLLMEEKLWRLTAQITEAADKILRNILKLMSFISGLLSIHIVAKNIPRYFCE